MRHSKRPLRLEKGTDPSRRPRTVLARFSIRTPLLTSCVSLEGMPLGDRLVS